ncbi:hypothetical protein KBY96_05160 [Cyanobium sp. ATX 6A2]|uniref:hypothetical protein n=1 Tax=Cyanobium sp. ATX 6A2 TaxID=2823700 RepID=UPI0020CF3F9E|nr:hypothetical protein [Cyanobium sp. ATX 6A2]MCP9887324.1 hypothetical protein [Cyanobium sp. ATX 6A2]
MSTARPFALRLFVPSGLPDGMRIVEKTNWSGIGYVGTPEKGIRRLDPNTANERRVVCPDAWLYSGQ